MRAKAKETRRPKVRAGRAAPADSKAPALPEAKGPPPSPPRVWDVEPIDLGLDVIVRATTAYRETRRRCADGHAAMARDEANHFGGKMPYEDAQE